MEVLLSCYYMLMICWLQRPNMKKIIDLKAQLARTFEMKDLGEKNKF
jgi:hypothetical protein